MNYHTLPYDQKQKLLQATRLLLSWLETEINTEVQNGSEESTSGLLERPHQRELGRDSILAPDICVGAPILDRPGDSFSLVWIDRRLDRQGQGQEV